MGGGRLRGKQGHCVKREQTRQKSKGAREQAREQTSKQARKQENKQADEEVSLRYDLVVTVSRREE